MYIKKFKNGNINVKKNTDFDGRLLPNLLNSCELDFEVAIDDDGNDLYDYCVGNFETATDLYNCNNGKMYTVLGNDTIDFMIEKTVKLIAYNGIQHSSYDNN